MKRFGFFLVLSALALCLTLSPAEAKYMLVGNDEKMAWDEEGKTYNLPSGKDTVQIFDISEGGTEPKLVVTLELMNSVSGPPTNMQITKDEKLALIANSMDWEQKDGKWTAVPGKKIYVIDMEANPPKLLTTVESGGLQPSGLAINRAGTLALVANRKDNSVSVFSIKDKVVTLVDTVPMEEQVSGVAITPDGTRAWVVKNLSHKLALLNIDGEKVTPAKFEIPVMWPYNVDIAPNGELAFGPGMGGPGASSGHVDTVSVIDMTQNPPRVIDRVAAGDGPEGFAVSPTGEYVAAVNIRGSNVATDSWFYNKNGTVSLLKVDGKKVTKVNEVEVGALPEGVVWSPDGKWLYVGNFTDKNMSVLKIEDGKLVDSGVKVPLAGSPASMRGPVN
ncbi:MAG: YncE family protein [Fretibacterium sp.]|nr:YncE family protein [Fretibacterium sp.]